MSDAARKAARGLNRDFGELAELLEHKTESLSWYKQVPEDDEHWFEAQVRSALLLDGEGKTNEALATIASHLKKAPPVKSLADYQRDAELILRAESQLELDRQIAAAVPSMQTAPTPHWASANSWSVPVLTPEQARARLAAKGIK